MFIVDELQVERVFKSVCTNNQIYGSFSAHEHIKKLYDQHKGKINEEVLKNLKEVKPQFFPTEWPDDLPDDLPTPF